MALGCCACAVKVFSPLTANEEARLAPVLEELREVVRFDEAARIVQACDCGCYIDEIAPTAPAAGRLPATFRRLIMAASSEWTEYHLTPGGWIEGSKQRDFAQVRRVEEPSDRVMTVVYKEVCNGYGAIHPSQQETWREGDTKQIMELLEKFGPAPKEL